MLPIPKESNLALHFLCICLTQVQRDLEVLARLINHVSRLLFGLFPQFLLGFPRASGLHPGW